MRIGVYGSSFDPITNVHLWTASTVIHRAGLDFVYMLVSQSRSRTDKDIVASDEDRYNMVELACAENPVLLPSNHELRVNPWEAYTHNTMQYFKEHHKDNEVFFIMGADCLVAIGEGEWKYGEELVANNKFIVMARDGINMLRAIAKSPLLRKYDDGRFTLIDKGLNMEISSTYVREEFAIGGNPRYLIPDPVYSYVKERGLYMKGDNDDQHQRAAN